MKQNEFSSRTINRLTQYHTVLRDYDKKNIASITSVQMSKLLNIDETQVRKDIKCINCKGRCKVGYSVSELKSRIEDVLDCKNVKRAYVIGAGNLGVALTKYAKFKEFGLEIAGIFDSDKSKIGTQINNLTVENIENIANCIKSSGVNIAILTIPNKVAQNVSDILTKAGIKYIWNFAPTIINVPDDVRVWNENLIGSFLRFCALSIR